MAKFGPIIGARAHFHGLHYFSEPTSEGRTKKRARANFETYAAFDTPSPLTLQRKQTSETHDMIRAGCHTTDKKLPSPQKRRERKCETREASHYSHERVASIAHAACPLPGSKIILQ